MKKILAFIMGLALLLCGALAETNQEENPYDWTDQAAGERLGLELLSMLYVPEENIVLSPQSLALVLGMAAEGAQGDTLVQLLDALGAKDLSEITAALPEELKSANALFVKAGLELDPETLERLNENYGAQQFVLGDDAVDRVNAWVREHTDELIEEMLTEAPQANIGLLLLNAVAMDAQWVSPFDPAANTTEFFHIGTGGESCEVEMMHQTEYFDYVEKDGLQAVRLPYAQGNMEMWIAMPEVGGMSALLENLTQAQGLHYLRSDAEEREVTLSLPKFDVSDENTLSDALKLLGMEDVFSADADFSGLSDVPMCLEEVLQKVRVQLDEDGTKAAAATAVSLKCMAAMDSQPPVEMTVDRPFAFLIVDGKTDAICFAGVIENPTAA